MKLIEKSPDIEKKNKCILRNRNFIESYKNAIKTLVLKITGNNKSE